MKNILLIATGGTIACSSSDEGLTPSANVNELLSYIPHIKEKCKLSGISIMNIDSTNMNPELMMNIAKAIKEYIENQLKADRESDQISLYDPRDPFTGSK